MYKIDLQLYTGGKMNPMENKATEIEEVKVEEISVIFISEEKLAESVGGGEWIMPCGHDCCQCDRECK